VTSGRFVRFFVRCNGESSPPVAIKENHRSRPAERWRPGKPLLPRALAANGDAASDLPQKSSHRDF
jgi:hypothetical protein